MFDREYTLVAHPRLGVRVAYRTDDGDLAAASVEIDYRGDGDATAAEPAAVLSDPADGADASWRGLDLALYRDGDRVFARETPGSLLSDAADLLDAVERFAAGVVRRGKRAAGRLARSDRVTMTQSDGSTIEALAPPAQATFELYEGADGRWRWRLRHDNGNVIADSGQGYSSKRAAEKGLRSVKRNALGAPVETDRADGGAGSAAGSAES